MTATKIPETVLLHKETTLFSLQFWKLKVLQKTAACLMQFWGMLVITGQETKSAHKCVSDPWPLSLPTKQPAFKQGTPFWWIYLFLISTQRPHFQIPEMNYIFTLLLVCLIQGLTLWPRLTWNLLCCWLALKSQRSSQMIAGIRGRANTSIPPF